MREATIALNQARTVALYSAYLKPAHRKLVLDRLAPAYLALGAGREAWDELEIALKPGGSGQTAAAGRIPVFPGIPGDRPVRSFFRARRRFRAC